MLLPGKVNASALLGRGIRLRTVNEQIRKSTCSREHTKARMRTGRSNEMCSPESKVAQGRTCGLQAGNGNMLSREYREGPREHTTPESQHVVESIQKIYMFWRDYDREVGQNGRGVRIDVNGISRNC